MSQSGKLIRLSNLNRKKSQVACYLKSFGSTPNCLKKHLEK